LQYRYIDFGGWTDGSFTGSKWLCTGKPRSWPRTGRSSKLQRRTAELLQHMGRRRKGRLRIARTGKVTRPRKAMRQRKVMHRPRKVRRPRMLRPHMVRWPAGRSLSVCSGWRLIEPMATMSWFQRRRSTRPWRAERMIPAGI